jgi:hypothetical protein
VEAKRMPMSGGKRNHEDVSDTMALVQAACTWARARHPNFIAARIVEYESAH